jgi:hypothetical protein
VPPLTPDQRREREIALENYLHPASQPPIFPPGTVIIIPAASVK